MINEQIRDREVRLIGENGELIGIMSAKEAYKLAQEAELDLVKIAPTAKLPEKKRKPRRSRRLSRLRRFVYLRTSRTMILTPRLVQPRSS